MTALNPKVVIFFINRFNDIDHMSPVIWQMSKVCNNVKIYSLNPNNDIFNDYRLKFLNTFPSVNLDFLYTNNSSNLFSYIFGHIICNYRINHITNSITAKYKNYFIWFFSRIIRLLLFRILKIDVSVFIRKIYDERWVEDLFKKERGDSSF